MPVVFQVADDWFNAASPSHLAFDGGRLDPSGLTDRDVEINAVDLVAAISLICIDPFYGCTGELGDLIYLARQRMPVIGGAGQSHGAQNELAALAALVGGGEGGFDAELVFSAGLAFADTFHLGRMQGVELVLVARLLPKDLLRPFQCDLEGGLQVRLSGDLALNVPDQATKPGAHFAQMAQALLVTAGVEQAAHFTPRMCRET